MKHPWLFKLSVFRHHFLGKPFFYGGLVPARAPIMQQVAWGERKRLGRPLEILEVGTFRGRSAVLWAEYGRVTCVDNWLDFCEYHVFKKNMEILGLRSPVDYIDFRANSDLALASMLTHGLSYDLVYIDGDHAYKGCKWDLHLGRQLVRPGGILCGDDLDESHPGVMQAVQELTDTVEQSEGFFWIRL